MASLNPTEACFPRNETLPGHQGYAQPYPYHPNTGAIAAPYIYQVDQTTVLTALHRRIAVLETQLTQIYTSKQQADQAAQYLLHIAAKNHGATAYPPVDQEDIQRLQRKLHQSQEENFELRLKLRKTIMLWGNNTHTRMVSPKGHGPVRARCEHASPTCPKACAETSCSAQNTSENTLVDLLDCLSVDDVPELDGSDGESEVDDGLDSISTHAPGLPQINLEAYGDCVVQDARNESFTGIFEHSGLAHTRHFSSSKDDTSIEKTGSRGNGLEEKTLLTIPIPSKATSAILPPGVYTERDIQPRKAAIHNSRVFPGKKPPVIDHQDATCGLDKLFSSMAERHTAIEINRKVAGPEDLRFPDLFRYGVHYTPSLQTNTLRTISIMNLPPKVSRSALLASIRGGIVVSVDLLDTVTITGASSALIVFLHGQDALAFKDFVAEHALYFDGQKACVKLLTTPTWPLSINLSTAIFQHHHTRCLEVFNYPRSITPAMLRKDLRLHQALKCDAIEQIKMRLDKVLEIQFMSIQAAGRAYGKLTSMRTYKQCRVIFAKDPCSLPLESLKIVESKTVRAEIAQREAPVTTITGPDSNNLTRSLYASTWAPPRFHQAPTDSSESESIPLLSAPKGACLPSQHQPGNANGQKKIFIPAMSVEAKDPPNAGLTPASLADEILCQQIVTGDITAQNASPANQNAANKPTPQALSPEGLPDTEANPRTNPNNNSDTKSIFINPSPPTTHNPASEPPSATSNLALDSSQNSSGSITDVDVQEYLDEHANELERWKDLDDKVAVDVDVQGVEVGMAVT